MDASLQTRRNFQRLSVLFSLGHACCTTSLAYATTLLRARHGEIGNGILFAVTIPCAMLASVPLLRAAGAKGGLLASLACFGLYEMSFAWAQLLRGAGALWVFSAGSASGGLALALGWVAQGSYMAHSATLVADAEGIPRDVATSDLASTFAVRFLVIEVAAKVAFSALQLVGLQPFWISLAFACAAIAALVMMTKIDPIMVDSSDPGAAMFDRTFECVALWRNPHIWLLAPTNFAFGCSAATMNGYVNAQLARADMVGLLVALSTASAAMLMPLTDLLARLYGKGAALVVGSASFLLLSLVLRESDPAHVWGNEVCVLYVVQGIGRAVYESTGKAIYADVFVGRDTEGAFANVFVQHALAGALGFFFQAGRDQPGALLSITFVLALSVMPLYALSILSRHEASEKAPLVTKDAIA